MIVNAPAPPEAGAVAHPTEAASDGAHLPGSSFAPKASFLLPGEILLWQGAPRKGAGWRCILRDADFGLALGGMAMMIVIVTVSGVAGGGAILPAVASGIGFVGLSGAITLFLLQRQLRDACYAVTDRRAIIIRGRTDRPTIESIHHAVASPHRHESRCGTTIVLGRGVTGNAAADRRERARTPVASFFSQPSDDDPQIAFRALDPADAPFDLLRSLAAASGLGLRTTPPIPGGFAQ